MGSGSSKSSSKPSEGNKNNSGGNKPPDSGSKPAPAQPSIPPAEQKISNTSETQPKVNKTIENSQPPSSEENSKARKVEGSASSKDKSPEAQKKDTIAESPGTAEDSGGTSGSKNKQDEVQNKETTTNSARTMNAAGKQGQGPDSTQKPVEEKLIDEGPKEQMKFDCALKSACLLVKPESLYKHVTKNVTKLHLARALPLHFSLASLLAKFDNLKDLDLSFNQMGPQCVRAICLAMCSNSSILSLNLADNKTDTDTADSIGCMLEENQTLQYLDVSSNYLGKDYFSRKVGPVLKTNKTLKTLRCESIGMTDGALLVEGLQENSSIEELDISSNSLSNPAAFCAGLATLLAKEDCVLATLNLCRCELNSAAVTKMQQGLEQNKSLVQLNQAAAQMDSQGQLLDVLMSAVRHPCLETLNLDSTRCKSTDVTPAGASLEKPSRLEVLSLSSCGLQDQFLQELESACRGKLGSLRDLDLMDNRDLTTVCLDNVVKLTSDDGSGSSLVRLRYGMNKVTNLGALLPQFPCLQYLNLRNCVISAEELDALGAFVSGGDCPLSSLILDGLKLSGSPLLASMLGKPKAVTLTTLSLGGCSLDDTDLAPLSDAIRAGLSITMLKLAANRITDVGVTALVEAVLKQKNCPLAVLDLSNNRLENGGAKALVKLFTSKSKLQSLNVSSNSIGKEGMLALVSMVGGKSSLTTLHVNGQSVSLEEADIVEVFTKLAATLGYKVQYDGDQVKPGCSDLPSNLPDNLMVNLTNLGGHSGSIGQALDSRCTLTDFIQDRCPCLSLEHIMHICAFLAGNRDGVCVWSEKDWNMITGADRSTTDTPAWLKIESERDKCIYISNLPGNATLQKIEAMLEMEADCNIDETCLMKDPVTRSINGVGWSVMSDQESVQRAIDYFNTGEAKVFGQAIMLSAVRVKVDNEASSALEHQARVERDQRQKQRAKEDSEHRTLIINTTEASWKRHAYRLAHPAYADGRIW